MELSRARDRLSPRDRGPAWPRECPLCVKKNALSSYRPTGRLDPTPADLAYGSLELAALEYQARRGEIKHFTGIDSDYEAPESPEIKINTMNYTPEEATNRIVSYLEKAGRLTAPKD